MEKKVINKYRAPVKRKLHRKKAAVLPNIFISHSFSDLEDDKDAFEIIRTLASNAGKNAAAEATAAGIPRFYAVSFNKLGEVSASGETVILLPTIKRKSFYIKYKPLTVLDAIR